MNNFGNVIFIIGKCNSSIGNVVVNIVSVVVIVKICSVMVDMGGA